LQNRGLDETKIERQATRRAGATYANLVRDSAPQIAANKKMLQDRMKRHFQVEMDTAELMELPRSDLRAMNKELERDIRSVENQLRDKQVIIEQLLTRKRQLQKEKKK
jgi:peptidoglycan hydrolase CwlO-like protein